MSGLRKFGIMKLLDFQVTDAQSVENQLKTKPGLRLKTQLIDLRGFPVLSSVTSSIFHLLAAAELYIRP